MAIVGCFKNEVTATRNRTVSHARPAFGAQPPAPLGVGIGLGSNETASLIRVSIMAIWGTTVLHRHFPAVREKPAFEGLLRCPISMAERESVNPHWKTKHFRRSQTKTHRLRHGREEGILPSTKPYAAQWPVTYNSAVKRLAIGKLPSHCSA
jgi:hypothetical protein